MSSIFSGHRLNNDKKDPTGTFTVGFLFCYYLNRFFQIITGGGSLNVKFVIYILKKQYITTILLLFFKGEVLWDVQRKTELELIYILKKI